MKPGEDGRELRAFDDAAALEAWLEAEHQTSDGLWILFAKKSTGTTTATYAEAVDIAICFGWIDGQVGRVDETYYATRFTPRRPRSAWSKINVEKVAALSKAGTMRPAGMAHVEAAKADGRWARAYAGAATAVPPPELQQLLDASPEAAEAFAALKGAERYAIIYRVGAGKKPETRERNAAKFTAMLESGEPLGL